MSTSVYFLCTPKFLRVFAFLGTSQEFDGQSPLQRNITIVVARTFWPANNAVVQVQLVPIPERKGVSIGLACTLLVILE